MLDKEIYKIGAQMNKRADVMVQYFLISFFVIGLGLSFFYDTWLIGICVGSMLMLAYFSCKVLLPASNLYQYVLSTVLGIFMAQFIYQMHGMFEMHFFAFIGSAILIIYRNWKLQIPLAIVVIVHHAVFGYLQFKGFDKIYFSQLEYMSLETFTIHALLAIGVFFLCGLWAYKFKQSQIENIKQSFEIGRLLEAGEQKEVLVAMSESLRASNEKIRKAHDELRALFDNIEDVFFSFKVELLDSTPCFITLQMSPACLKIYGYSVEDFFNSPALWRTVSVNEDQPIIEQNFRKLLKGHFIEYEYRIRHRSGAIRWVQTKIKPTLNADNLLVRIDGITVDITDKIEMRKKLESERNSRLQEITEAVITAQEKERLFLGEELHDNINPTLATVKLYMESAIADEDMRVSLISESKGFVSMAMEEIRTLSRSLVSPLIKGTSLVDAVEDIIKNYEKVNSLNIIMDCEGIDEGILDEKLKLTIFRIIQEQLNNIFKYASANTATIQLKQNCSNLQLTIKDDGVGFDISQKRKGVGLQNITSRADLFNGSVHINSQPGAGCELVIDFGSYYPRA
jgi:PAS domain S-box-containing protein